MCPARPLCLLRSSRQPFLSEPPPLGSSFITLTWETQRDFFHPRALMFSLSQSLRCPFYTLFRRRHTSFSPSSTFLFSFFARPACFLFHAGDLAMFFQLLFALHGLFIAFRSCVAYGVILVAAYVYACARRSTKFLRLIDSFLIF